MEFANTSKYVDIFRTPRSKREAEASKEGSGDEDAYYYDDEDE